MRESALRQGDAATNSAASDKELTAADRARDRTHWWKTHDKETYECPDCGSGAEDVEAWHVHHINREPGNVVALCRTCHWVRHGGDRKKLDLDVWKDEFLGLGAEDS